jgi:hypothetical protein
MSASSAPLSTPEGPGSVYIDTGGLRQHAVFGGEELLAGLTPFLAPYPDRG